MLFRQTLIDELEKKGDEFRRFLSEYISGVGEYLAKLKMLETTPSDEIGGRLATAAALPSEELDRGSFSIAFGESWENHEQAREWANDVLDRRVTFAADGSQIYTGKET